MGWKRLALAAAILAAGCSEAKLSDGPGGMTPAECFAKVRDVRDRFDWRTLPDHYAPESHAMLLLNAVAPFAEARRDAKKSGKPESEDVHFVEGILREKGISLDALVKTLDKGEAAMLKHFESVIDRRGLFAAVMVQTAGANGWKRPKMVRLEDVVIGEETAHGRGVFQLGDAEPTTMDVRFRQIGGRWFMVLGDPK